ncbi:MAG TPA: lipopolysaccharide kinase InaA family protein [Candidatus Binatia bacterium]
MTQPDNFEIRHDGRWRLRVQPAAWSGQLWTEICARIAETAPDKHPRTLRLAGGYYLKIYSPPKGAARIKDVMRRSKAMRALKQTDALSRLGFHAPPVVAAGEERAGGFLRGAFLLMREIDGRPLIQILRERFVPPLGTAEIALKRRWLSWLAAEIRRMHASGFVHGDLVPSNVFVGFDADGEAIFYFMDHDRTRRYPRGMPHWLWRRNLVQLNRIVLPGVSLQDRMRFARVYLGRARWGKNERRLIRWLERRTRRRRKECERIEAKVSFRELMRWNGPFAKNL